MNNISVVYGAAIILFAIAIGLLLTKGKRILGVFALVAIPCVLSFQSNNVPNSSSPATPVEEVDQTANANRFKALQICEDGDRELAHASYENAIAEFDKAIALDPNCYKAFHTRGIAYYKLKEYTEAIRDLTTCIQLNPRHAQAFYNRGLVRMEIGDLPGALRDVQTSHNLFVKTNKAADAAQIEPVLQTLKQKLGQ